MGVDNHAEAHRCLCGFYKKDLHRDCTCHPQQIAHQAGRLRKLVARYDMLAEPSRPKWPEIITKENEPFARVWERIQASQKQPVPTGIEPGATKLLETAYARLSLVPGSVFKIIAVAHTIARMGRHETVQAPDMAEAIQYRVE
jgi:predicted ATPase with chaperone activity